jgi:hypothetical protein
VDGGLATTASSVGPSMMNSGAWPDVIHLGRGWSRLTVRQ